MAQNPELTSARQHLRAGARSNAEQSDHDGDQLEHIGHRKSTIESLQRHATQFPRRAHVVFARIAETLANLLLHGFLRCPFRKCQRQSVHPLITSERDVASTLHDDRAARMLVIPPDAADICLDLMAFDPQAEIVAGGHVQQICSRLR